MAYTADINIVVRGQAAVNKLQRDLDALATKLDDITKRRIGPSTALETFNAQLAEAKRRLNEVAAGTSAETEAIKNYVTALGNANAASDRQNKLIQEEINLREAATGQVQKLADRQAEFTARTNEAAQAAHKQTAEFIRQQRVAKQVAALNASAPAAQLLLPAAAPGSPEMSGGARRRITGPVERLGGARTEDQAAMALRFAQALQQQIRPLSQIDALYAGIAGEAAKLQQIKALPDSAMLNASARGIKQLQNAEELLNNERLESAARVRELDRLEASRERRAAKLRDRAAYEAGAAPTEVATGGGPGFGAGLRGRAGGAISSAIIGGGFPLLFGQGAAAAVGGGLGGLAGGLLGGGFGFALSIAGTAIGDLISQTETLDKSLATLNSSLSTVGSSSLTTADDVKELAKNLGVTKEEAIALIGTFSQFRDAGTREALASLFGNVGGAATFEAIARAGIDEKNALSSIFSLRQQIGNEAATQLALQLDAVGATETQATLLKLVVEQSIRSSVAAAQQVKYTDNLLSTWENIVGAVAAGLSLAIKFIQKMQEGALIQLPFLTQIQQFLQGKKGRSGQQIADERATQLEKSLRSQLEAARRAVRQETGALGVESMLTDRGRNSDKAARDAARLAEQRQKQLEAAARMAVSTDTQLKKAAAINKEEQLAADMDQQRMERMVKYETLYRDALSNAEIEYLVTAQTNEILAEKLNHEQAILDIRLEQSRLLNEADPLKNTQQEIDLLAAKIQGKEEEYLRQQAINELVSRGVVIEDAIAHVDVIKELNARLQQQAALEQLVASVGQGMGNALTGVFDALIARADNFNEVMANTLASLGRFLMMAGLNALADLGDPSGQGVGILSFLGFGKGFGKRAGGGPVKGGVPFVVGERGPELFVPGTSGGVMSNSDLRASMGAAPGSSGGPVLNMTFETSTINGVEYVSRDQLEAAMAVTRRQAARDGASRGMTMTLDRLQQSPSTRRKVGI